MSCDLRSAALDRALSRGMLLAALFAAVAGAARVAQDASIAWRYGTGPTVDAYYVLLSLVGLPVAVALSTFTFLLAPAEVTRAGGPGRAHALARGLLLGRVLAAAVLAWALGWWALDAIVASGLSGLRAGAAQAARDSVPQLVAMLPLGLVGALLCAWLIAAGRHVVTLLEALPALVLTLCLLTLPGPVLFWGTAAGFAVQALALAAVLAWVGALPRPRLRAAREATATMPAVARGVVVLVAGQMLFALIPLVDPFFAARLGEGTVAALGFANRLVLGLQGLAGLALQRAGLPLLARLAADSPADLQRTVRRWALGALLAGSVLGAAVAAGADALVGLLFERGLFTAQDRAHVATLLRYGMWQMPPFLVGTVLVTALAATRRGTSLAQAGVVGLLAKLMLSAWLVAGHGAPGLLVATALMYTLTSALVWWSLQRPPPAPPAASP